MTDQRINLASPILAAMHPGNPHGLRYADGDAGEGASGGTGQQDGQSGAGDTGSGEGGSQGGDGKNGQQAGDQGTDTGKDDAGKTDAEKVEDLPEWAQKQIRDLRKENGDRRTKLTAAEEQQREVVKAFAKAAGIELPGDEDKQTDPAELTQKLTASQQAQRDTALELALYKSASTAGADPTKLLDSRSFMATVKDVDPTDAAAVKAAIDKAVTENPMLKAQAAGKSSADHAGGSGEGRTRKDQSVDDAVSQHYGT